MNMNIKNQTLKLEIINQYGNYKNFAKKTGYSSHYISNVINGRNPITSDFRQFVNEALGGDYWQKNKSRDLVNYLLESSSLRSDLLNQVGGAIKDILNCIDLNDELCARVKDSTYEFIKEWNYYEKEN